MSKPLKEEAPANATGPGVANYEKPLGSKVERRKQLRKLIVKTPPKGKSK